MTKDQAIALYQSGAWKAMSDEWVASDEDWGPFSFVRLCLVLDLEPAWTRRRIRRLQTPVSYTHLTLPTKA